MSTLRFLFSLTLIAYLLFNFATCSYQECSSGQTCSTATVNQKSSTLNRVNVQVVAVVSYAISFPGLKVYSLLDNSGRSLMVKAPPMDGSVPEVGTTVVVCGVVHEVINVNGSMKLVVLEELDRQPIPAVSLSLK